MQTELLDVWSTPSDKSHLERLTAVHMCQILGPVRKASIYTDKYKFTAQCMMTISTGHLTLLEFLSEQKDSHEFSQKFLLLCILFLMIAGQSRKIKGSSNTSNCLHLPYCQWEKGVKCKICHTLRKSTNLE